MQTYLVGGAVRDELLGLVPTEYDWLVVGSTPDEMLSLGYIQVGKDFPVFLHPKTKEEYALARTERKIGGGYKGFNFQSKKITLEQDLLRRDLTINAIAKDNNGNLIDPYNGLIDLEHRRLHAVSDAFVEDPVRVLRIARFAAKLGKWDFKVSDTTKKMLKKITKNGELDFLVPERVWTETQKALTTDYPEKFIKVLKDCGALEKIFPEIYKLFGVPQAKKYHPEIDTGTHTLLALQQAVKLSNKPEVRFATLVHDLGKGMTKIDILPNHYGHELKGVKLVQQLCKRLKIPKSYSKLAILVTKYHVHFHKIADELTPKSIVNLLNNLDAFRNPSQFHDFILACKADQQGTLGYKDFIFQQADFLQKTYCVANQVNAKIFIQQGIKGKDIKEAIHKARIIAIKKLIISEKINYDK